MNGSLTSTLLRVPTSLGRWFGIPEAHANLNVFSYGSWCGFCFVGNVCSMGSFFSELRNISPAGWNRDGFCLKRSRMVFAFLDCFPHARC